MVILTELSRQVTHILADLRVQRSSFSGFDSLVDNQFTRLAVNSEYENFAQSCHHINGLRSVFTAEMLEVDFSSICLLTIYIYITRSTWKG